MNGVHDMGGMHGFGMVLPERDEPVFHADWERRVFALTLAMGATGEWTLDASRFARENRPPDDYLDKTYYEIWLAGLQRLNAMITVQRPTGHLHDRRRLRSDTLLLVLASRHIDFLRLQGNDVLPFGDLRLRRVAINQPFEHRLVLLELGAEGTEFLFQLCAFVYRSWRYHRSSLLQR